MSRAERLTSHLLEQAGFRHAFFTRAGGVSSGAFASLNFSVSVGDDPEHVAENLRRAAATLEIPAERLLFLSQVHGRACHAVDGAAVREQTQWWEGDALVSRFCGVACGVRTADCVPILIADRESGAVAAVHAGWRGVACQVATAAIERLRALTGTRGDLIAAIGPHIEQGAFEVSEEVAAELERVSLDKGVVDRTGNKPHVDLRRIVRAELRTLGLADDAIDDVHGCTASAPERFFSFRRDGKRSGRHLSAIVPRPV